MQIFLNGADYRFHNDIIIESKYIMAVEEQSNLNDKK